MTRLRMRSILVRLHSNLISHQTGVYLARRISLKLAARICKIASRTHPKQTCVTRPDRRVSHPPIALCSCHLPIALWRRLLFLEAQYQANSFVIDGLLKMFVNGLELFTPDCISGCNDFLLHFDRHPAIDARDAFVLH